MTDKAPSTRAAAERLKATTDDLAPFVSRDTMTRFRFLLMDALDMAYERDAEIERLHARLAAIAEVVDGPVNDFETPLRRLDMILRLAVHNASSAEADQ